MNMRKVKVVGEAAAGFGGTGMAMVSDFWWPMSMVDQVSILTGQKNSIADSADDWERDVERIRDGVVKKEAGGRAGKTEGQPAHTREAKLGSVFTQTSWDKEGYAIRDPDSTTYVGAIETAQEFGLRLYLEACKRGWNRAEKKVVIGDGAEWIWNIADQHFPGTIQVVDLYHARQHLWELARKLFPNQQAEQERWMVVHKDVLLEEGRLKTWWRHFIPSFRPIRSCQKRSASKPTTLRKTPHACGTPSSARNI
jgi:hypothetical protein